MLFEHILEDLLDIFNGEIGSSGERVGWFSHNNSETVEAVTLELCRI